MKGLKIIEWPPLGDTKGGLLLQWVLSGGSLTTGDAEWRVS